MLREIVAKDLAAIPFENLGVLPGRVPPLDRRSIMPQAHRQRRGGYGFEHNTLSVTVLGARHFRFSD
jgi:N-hydroxyarylamine O-acetyltransferase